MNDEFTTVIIGQLMIVVYEAQQFKSANNVFFSSGPEASLVNKNHQDVRNYVRQFNVIDNQRTLSQMSHRLEPRRT